MSNIQRRINSANGSANFARPPMAAVNAAGITPKEAIGIARRHILMIVLFTLSGLLIGGVIFKYKQINSPLYTARGAIEILPPGDVDPFDLTGIQPNKEIYHQLRTTIAERMKRQEVLSKLIQNNKIRGTKWFKEIDKSTAATKLIRKIIGSPTDKVTRSIYSLKKNLSVSPDRNSNLIFVSMTCGSTEDSALIVNEFMRLFRQNEIIRAQGGTSIELGNRKKDLATLEGELTTLNKSLNSFRKGSPNFGNLNQVTFQDYLEQKLANIERLNDDLATQQSGLGEVINNLQRRVDSDYDEVVRERIERDTIASNMRQRISILETSLARQLARFGEGHRRIREARDAIDQSRSELAFRQKEIGDIERGADLIRAKEEMITLQARIVTTETRLELAKKSHKTLSDLRADYEKTTIKRDDKQQAIEKMERHVQALEARHENSSQTSKLGSISSAPKPLEMSSPRGVFYVFGGFLLGLLAGIGLAFAKELLNDVLRSPSDISKHLRVPLLGMISHTDEDEALGGVNIYHVVRQAPYSIMSECYRQFRTNLRLSESGARHKSLLITSCNSGCGKTTAATNLSATLVAEGMRVLLIDTNFRRPSLAGLFPRNAEDGSSDGADSGLSNYLLGQCSFEDICRESSLENLDIIDAGPLPSNPSELLSNIKMTELINQANTAYDYVIIDGPPLIVSDAKILASQVDSTIIVFNAMSTRRGEAQRSLRELREINADIAGTVLLGVRSMKGGYFQEVYKSYLQYQQVQLAASSQ